MKGHEGVIAMRKSGVRPAIVFINDYACETDWFEHGDHATVQILPDEAVEMLDFRFAIGLTVSITGSTVKRAKAIARACRDAGAVTVGAGCPMTDERGFTVPGWAHIWHKVIEEKEAVHG